jgi:hypothetical protein
MDNVQNCDSYIFCLCYPFIFGSNGWVFASVHTRIACIWESLWNLSRFALLLYHLCIVISLLHCYIFSTFYVLISRNQHNFKFAFCLEQSLSKCTDATRVLLCILRNADILLASTLKKKSALKVMFVTLQLLEFCIRLNILRRERYKILKSPRAISHANVELRDQRFRDLNLHHGRCHIAREGYSTLFAPKAWNLT